MWRHRLMAWWKRLGDWPKSFLIATVLLLLMEILFIRWFTVHGDSMHPTLLPGDMVMVSRTAKIFGLEHHDVIVMRDPTAERGARRFIKRIIGMPGDTVQIRGGQVWVNGKKGDLIETNGGLPGGKRQLSIFPYSPTLGWTRDDFGPLIIPKKGMTLSINTYNLPCYDRAISHYEDQELYVEGGELYLGDEPFTHYTFEKNYYFVLGDDRARSNDSRYWGLLPAGHIVGKATWVCISMDEHTGGIRWDRKPHRIH